MLDYLIIGHGLAGAILSNELLAEGKKIMVINHSSLNSASAVAGGLYNPITGRKMVKTWNADNIFPMIEPYYQGLENKLGTKILHDVGIYRPFLTVEEQNEWQGKAASPEFTPYVRKVYTSSRKKYLLQDQYGGIQLKKAGYVNTKALIDSNKNVLLNKGNYKELMFHENQLNKEEHGFSFEGLKFRRIIFCNGFNPSENSWFSWLPFSPVKGEVLRVELEKNEIDTILNRGVFLLPIKGNACRAGATYNWREINSIPSEEGQMEIETKLNNLYRGNYKVIGRDAGIRPATKDRRPFIGLHPNNERIGIFNGFGSKGVSLIPYYAKKFIDHLERNVELEPEVNVYRYFSLS